MALLVKEQVGGEDMCFRRLVYIGEFEDFGVVSNLHLVLLFLNTRDQLRDEVVIFFAIDSGEPQHGRAKAVRIGGKCSLQVFALTAKPTSASRFFCALL